MQSCAICDCRPTLWFWNSVVLYTTLALAVAQVFATTLDAYYQVTVMLMVLLVGFALLAHLRPFVDPLAQRMQVCQQHDLATGCAYRPCNLAYYSTHY